MRSLSPPYAKEGKIGYIRELVVVLISVVSSFSRIQRTFPTSFLVINLSPTHFTVRWVFLSLVRATLGRMQRWQAIIVGGGLILLVFFPRVLDLDTFRSPDEDRWMANTSGFTMKLAHGRLAELVQQPHPGIITQWLGALTIRYDNWATRKLPLVFGQSLLILLAGYVFGRLWGKLAGWTAVAALAVNPLLYAHTRVYAMDSLLALFSILALGLLLLWRQEKNQPYAVRYLVASAFCTAAAILSKLPGVALLPVIGSALLYWEWQVNALRITHYSLRNAGLWLFAFVFSASLMLPSLALAPGDVFGDFREFFRSDAYQSLHQLSSNYYLGTLLFFSTPLHWLTLGILAWLAVNNKLSRSQREQFLILLLYAIVLVIQMSVGAKKGDRYILPSFVILDVMAAWVLANTARFSLRLTHYTLLLLLIWQFVIIWQTHPHTLAYVNPLTGPWFGERRHGWGEGLDIAAAYLNQKPNSDQLKVATYYPVEFAPYFVGEAVPAHQHDEPSVDYVLIYRAMLARGEDAWETEVRTAYQVQSPEKVIELAGIPMVWVYAKPASGE